MDGIRHAILSHDDPLLNIKSRKRSQTSVTKDKTLPIKYEPYNSKRDGLDNCFLKLRLVVDNKCSEKNIQTNLIRRQSAPCSKSSSKTLGNVDLQMNSILNLVKNYKEDLKYKTDNSHEEDIFQSETILSLRKLFNDDFENRDVYLKKRPSIASHVSKDNKFDLLGSRANQKLEESQTNPLSERVLQWLDLSGKVQNFKCEKTEESSKDLLKNEESSEVKFIRQRSPLSKRDNLSPISIQSYKLDEEGKGEETFKRIMKRRFLNTKDTSQDFASEKKFESQFEDFYEIDLKNIEQISKLDNLERESTWTPPLKPQLHIFMPSLKPTEKYSSQESLIFD